MKKKYIYLGIVIVTLVLVTTGFYFYRKHELGSDKWYEFDHVKEEYIVHYYGAVYRQIEKDRIPIAVEDQDWDYTGDILLRGPDITIGDYLFPIDIIRPHVSVLNNEKGEDSYMYIETNLAGTIRYYKKVDK